MRKTKYEKFLHLTEGKWQENTKWYQSLFTRNRELILTTKLISNFTLLNCSKEVTENFLFKVRNASFTKLRLHGSLRRAEQTYPALPQAAGWLASVCYEMLNEWQYQVDGISVLTDKVQENAATQEQSCRPSS